MGSTTPIFSLPGGSHFHAGPFALGADTGHTVCVRHSGLRDKLVREPDGAPARERLTFSGRETDQV